MKACRIAFSENDAANREDAAAINFQNIFFNALTGIGVYH